MGYHPTTARTRFNYISEFLQYLEQKGSLDIIQITSDQIQNYYEHLSNRPSLNTGTTLSPKTIYHHLRNVRDLFTMLQDEKQVKTNPVDVMTFRYPSEKSKRNILTQSEITELYEACESAQEKAILSLAYGCGLRAAELSKCNVEDVKLRSKILIVPQGKGMKRRVIPMSKGVVKDLTDYYYLERPILALGKSYKVGLKAFMLHSRGGRMNKWTYNKYLKEMIKRTGNKQMINKQITLHCLRHSIATHLIEQGIGVEKVRLFLGHSQLETTQVYTRISQEQLAKLVNNDTEQKEDDLKEIPP